MPWLAHFKKVIKVLFCSMLDRFIISNISFLSEMQQLTE